MDIRTALVLMLFVPAATIQGADALGHGAHRTLTVCGGPMYPSIVWDGVAGGITMSLVLIVYHVVRWWIRADRLARAPIPDAHDPRSRTRRLREQTP